MKKKHPNLSTIPTYTDLQNLETPHNLDHHDDVNIKKNHTERDRAIVTLRIIAMVSIILVHLMPYFGLVDWIYYARVGTPLFFLISGYLYGQRNVSKWGAFYLRRWKTLMIPAYIGIAAMMIILSPFRLTKYSFNQYLTHFLNLGGVTWMDATPHHDMYSILTINGNLEYIHNFLHLWFMTYLMICLFLVPLFQSLRNKFSSSKAWMGGWMPITLAVLILIILNFIGLNLWYIVIFMIGYCVNTNLIPCSSKGVILFAALIFAGFTGEYLISGYKLYLGKYFCASYIPLQAMIVCGILGLTQYIFRTFPNIKGLPDMGNLPYCIFITHFPCFLIFHRLSDYPLIALVLYFIATLLTGLGLQFINKFVQRIM